MCLISKLGYNGLRLYAVRDCGLLSCQPAPQFERGRMFNLPLIPLIAYSLAVSGRYFFLLGLNSIGIGIDISFIQSIANLSVMPEI